MRKKLGLFVLVALMLMALTACKSNEEATSNGLLNEDLVKLLPNENFKWAYMGQAEYYHEMTLESIIKDEKQAIYKVVGEVEDVSGGDSGNDYNTEVFYEINDTSIIQRKAAPMMMDSEYDTITLIKAPLEEGNTWTEEIKDRNGKKQTIVAEIITVEEREDGMMYTVYYQNKKEGYTESRMIMDGFGVLAFKKSITIDGETFPYSYSLYGKGSGYIVKTEETTDQESIEDPVDETSDMTNDTDEAEDTTDAEATDESNDTGDDTSDETSTPVETTDEKAVVKSTLESFNAAWIKYVNNGDQTFFDYVLKGGQAYNNAKGFDSTGLTEKFLTMDVNQVTVNGKVATAKVFEEIEKTKDGQVTVVKYNWLYELVKVDGKWLVKGYTKQ